MEHGGDVRCFILDNQRPIHLANVYSRHNVVVFDDNQEGNTRTEHNENDSMPSDGSVLSLDSNDSTSDEDEDTLSMESVIIVFIIIYCIINNLYFYCILGY